MLPRQRLASRRRPSSRSSQTRHRRSILITELDSIAPTAAKHAQGREVPPAPHLICALGDGQLLTAPVSKQDGAVVLGKEKRAGLGGKAISLKEFKQGGARCVFAACDRPTVIYLGTGKLLLSSVNVGEFAHHLCKRVR